MIGLEELVGLVSRALKDYNHETSHEEGSVDHLLRFLRSAVVEDPVISIIFISKKPCQLSTISMDHSNIQWPKILVKRHVSKIVVDVEEEGILKVLRRFVV